jgi:hypothetical protein
MRVTTRVLAFAIVLLGTLLSSLAWGQANVDESKETAHIYVDQEKGNDHNPGTQAKPLQTISAAAELAVRNNQANIGSKVIIMPGTYRESVQFYGTRKDTSKPVTFQASSPGKSILSGGEIWKGWDTYEKNHQIFHHNWPHHWGLCPHDTDGAPFEEDIVRRREMIFVDGEPLTQVLRLKAMRVGTFYVSDQENKVYIWPAPGKKIENAKVEVASRDLLFNVGNRSNLVLRGLTFQYSNACRGETAVSIHNSDNVLLDQVTFRRNNASGLVMWQTEHATVKNTAAKYNGTSGLKGQKTKYTDWHNIVSRYNGWRGAQGVYYKWGESGLHFGLAHQQTLSKIDASWNQSPGLHWDTDNVNAVADSIIASQNVMTGAVVEKTQGPLTISNSFFCNHRPATGPNNVGITLRNSMNVTLTGNTLLLNRNQVVVTGEAGGIRIKNWETGEGYNLRTKNVTFHNNVVVSESDQRVFNNPELGGKNWSEFRQSLVSDYNTWWNADQDMDFTVPSPDPYTKLDFHGWKQASGADSHSQWTDPGDSGDQCNVTPEDTDFWFVMGFQDGYQSVRAGHEAEFTADVVALNFNGTVKLSWDGLNAIPGASGSWSTSKIEGSGSSTFKVKTSPSTKPGDYDITLLASSGNLTRTMTVHVVVK